MPIPFAIVAGGFFGSIAAAIVRFALSKVGHFVAAMGLTMIAYKGMDIVFDSLIANFGNNISAATSATISVLGSQAVPAGTYLLSIMNLIGLFEAANVIFSAAISAVALKQATILLRRTSSL